MKFVDENGITRYIGPWRGRVLETEEDKRKQGRIRLLVPDVYGSVPSPLALPSLPPEHFGVPPVGTQVWVDFEQGDPDLPRWTGCLYSSFSGAQGAAPSMVGEDDETTAFVIGKGGGAVSIQDTQDETKKRKIVEPVTRSKPSYGHTQSLRIGSTFVEVDGTPGEERIQIYHRSGAYFEFGPTGSLIKVSKGSESDWVKGSRTNVTVGPKTEVVEGVRQTEVKKDDIGNVRGDEKKTVDGDRIFSTEGKHVEEIGGSRTVEVSGLDTRRAGAVSDISAGNRAQATMGSEQQIVTGARIVDIANDGFAKGQVIGLGYTVALGDIQFKATTGNYRVFAGQDVVFETPIGKMTIGVDGSYEMSTGAGVLSIDPSGLTKIGSKAVNLLDLVDQILESLITSVTATAIGPQPLAAVASLAAIKVQLATIKGV